MRLFVRRKKIYGTKYNFLNYKIFKYNTPKFKGG